MTAIIILGASVWADGPSPTLRRRTQHAAELFKAGKGSHLVPCGGLGPFPPSEAEAMHDLLIAAGIPSSAIHMEAQSQTTYENLRNAQAVLAGLGITKGVIVTDHYHKPRAALVARTLGLRATCDAPANTGVPVQVRLRRLRHEALAIVAYAIRLPFWVRRDTRDQNWLRNIS